MNKTVLNVLLILVFIVVSGVFVAAEMSLISLRDSQIRNLSSRSSRGRKIASLTGNPNRFLSAVQIGVTLTGFLSAAFGEATLSDELGGVLAKTGMHRGVADILALVVITILISYFAIVVGELTAKRLALQRSVGFALALAPLVDAVAVVLRPVIWFLGVSTNVLVRILGGDPAAGRGKVSDEEIRAMVSGSTTLGDEERHIVDEVFAAGERGLREVMVPRTEVAFVPGRTPVRDAVQKMRDSPHSRYPVTGDSADDVLGFVHVRDLFAHGVADSPAPIRSLVRPVMSLPGTVRVLRAMSDMRAGSAHLAIVLDEYGGTAGIVTLEDLVEELVGEINDEYDLIAPRPLEVPDRMEVDGLLSLDEFFERTGQPLPEGHYDTVAGFVMASLGEVPSEGAEIVVDLAPSTEGSDDDETLEPVAWRFVVTELDGRRASRVRAERVADVADGPVIESGTPAPAQPPGPAGPDSDAGTAPA